MTLVVFLRFFNYHNLIKNIQNTPYDCNLNLYLKTIHKKAKYMIYKYYNLPYKVLIVCRKNKQLLQGQ